MVYFRQPNDSIGLRRTSTAVEQRQCATLGLLHHSDRGCRYTSELHQSSLKTLGITCSVSRSGCCYDNAVMERFFWTLKHE
ncbi:hypothetical protein Rcae01_03476 [Novipirellula caenicola]|uniref:Integrase core domain protein n=1 Tax=Novipirellula caenicola TaxID=1536901 RepID=A0ABP9VT73_9BACT